MSQGSVMSLLLSCKQRMFDRLRQTRPRRPAGLVLRADAAAMEASVRAGAPALAPEIRGRDSVTNIFRGRARAAQLASVDGDSGLVFAPGGQPRVVVDFVL